MKTTIIQKTAFFVFTLLIVNTSYGQIKVYDNNDVGIGVSYSKIWADHDGKVGIWTNSPNYNFDIRTVTQIRPGSSSIIFDGSGYYGATRMYPLTNTNIVLGLSNNQWLEVRSFRVYANNVQLTSDERLKENIKIFSDGLSTIKKIKTYTFDYKDEYLKDTPEKTKEKLKKETKDRIGFLAQEILEVLPNFVLQDSATEMYSISYMDFIPLLVNAVNEQQTIIKELEEKIKVLETSSTEKDLKKLALTDFRFLTDTSSAAATLLQNNPNPFNERTEIKYTLSSQTQFADVYIYNMQGKVMEKYSIENMGTSSIFVEGASLNPGMYFYSLIADGKEVDTKKMILTE